MSSAISTAARPILFPHLPSPASYRRYHQPGPQIPVHASNHIRKNPALVLEATLSTGGLHTPPAEANMSTAYHPHTSALSSTYNSHVTLARQPGALAQPSRVGSALYDAPVHHVARSQPQQQQQYQLEYQSQPQQSHYASNITSANSVPYTDASRHSTRASTPSSTATSVKSHFEGTVSRRDSTMVMHSLQLPNCISPNGGNLDDFASLVSGSNSQQSIPADKDDNH